MPQLLYARPCEKPRATFSLPRTRALGCGAHKRLLNCCRFLIHHSIKMPFVKQTKNSAYFSRYQVKYRRRREGKTDYQARKALTRQAKDKYNAPKYRLVVRFSNKYVTVQIVSAKIQGDVVLTHATSRELPRYGIKHGLSNWTAGE